MIKRLEVKGFKCFSEQAFDCKKITVLAGLNGAGKTSLLNIFALLHQTICESVNFDRLILNGQVISLGCAMDVLNRSKSRSDIYLKVELSNDKTSVCWAREYKAKTKDEFTLEKCRPGEGADRTLEAPFKRLTYISADRQGPREMHSLEGSGVYSSVGVRGERTISKLLEYADNDVLPSLVLADVPPQLLRQTGAYMQQFFPGFTLDIQPIKGTNLATLGLATNTGIGFVRPQNTGFGLSYSLPICVAGLTAKPDDMVMIENPEAHLHPSAQSHMGRFLAKVANTGVQIMVETHSDHFLNGIRRAVKDKQISHKDVGIYFFAGLDKEDNPVINQIKVLEDGKLENWPQNFFDQYDVDLADLTEW